MVGVRRFELLTSSVSGKRSPPELNAQISAAGVAARSILRENARVTQPSIESFSRITITSQREGPRASGAGVPRTHACAEESPAPARKRRREGTLVRDCCGNAPSGEELTPQRRLSTEIRTRRALRRRSDAGRKVPYAIAAGTRPPARKRRRRGHFGSKRCENRLSGAEMTPRRGAFRTCQRRKRASRRHHGEERPFRRHGARNAPAVTPCSVARRQRRTRCTE